MKYLLSMLENAGLAKMIVQRVPDVASAPGFSESRPMTSFCFGGLPNDTDRSCSISARQIRLRGSNCTGLTVSRDFLMT